MAIPHLVNRQMQIPGGLKFYLPEVKWRAPAGSLETIAQALLAVIRANPALAAKNKWPTDLKGCEDWVDLYNSTVCQRMGWKKFIVLDAGAGTAPKSLAPHQASILRSLKNAAERSKELVQGAQSLLEWEDSGEPPVPPAQALARATVCADCNLNDPNDLTQWFTVPAAELIKRRIAKLQARQLTTPRDDQLHLCTACHCPLKLKVHVPIAWIGKRISPHQKAKMAEGKNCWILRELATP